MNWWTSNRNARSRKAGHFFVASHLEGGASKGKLKLDKFDHLLTGSKNPGPQGTGATGMDVGTSNLFYSIKALFYLSSECLRLKSDSLRH